MSDRVVKRVQEVRQNHAERKAVKVFAEVRLTVFEIQHFAEIEAIDEHENL